MPSTYVILYRWGNQSRTEEDLWLETFREDLSFKHPCYFTGDYGKKWSPNINKAIVFSSLEEAHSCRKKIVRLLGTGASLKVRVTRHPDND